MQEAAAHARLYIADTLETAAVPAELRTQGADVEHFVMDAFGIDDARALFSRAHIRPVARPRREFLMYFQNATTEAQNALLKLFEDPPPDTVFHVVVPREELLIPTLRSRMQRTGDTARSKDTAAFDAFLRMSYGERLELIKARTAKKDVAWVETIASGAERFAAQEAARGTDALLKSVVFVRQYLGARGASSKMLLEEFALTLPVLK